MDGIISAAHFEEIVGRLRAWDAATVEQDIEWSEKAGPPESAEDFASEAIFVICNSGMKNTVARRIYDKVMAALSRGDGARTVFGHPGKGDAIDNIWAERETWLWRFERCTTDTERLDVCASMPWIGPITKYHLAKNFGVDVAKPDVHLQRLADLEGVTPQELCERLAQTGPYLTRTVDLLLWRACAVGIIDSRSGDFTP